MDVKKPVKETKKLALEELAGHLKGSSISLFATFNGLSTPELFEAKKKIKSEKAAFRVVKKSLLRKAFESLGIEPVSKEFWKGEVATLTSANGDPIRLARVLAQWKENSKKIVIKGGFLLEKRQWLEPVMVEKLAKLGGIRDLQTQAVATLIGPLWQLAGVLNGALSQLVLVLKSIQESKDAGRQSA